MNTKSKKARTVFDNEFFCEGRQIYQVAAESSFFQTFRDQARLGA